MDERERLITLCTYGTSDEQGFVVLLSEALKFDPDLPIKIAGKVGLPDPMIVAWSKGVSIPPTNGLRRFVLSLCAEALMLCLAGVVFS